MALTSGCVEVRDEDLATRQGDNGQSGRGSWGDDARTMRCEGEWKGYRRLQIDKVTGWTKDQVQPQQLWMEMPLLLLFPSSKPVLSKGRG